MAINIHKNFMKMCIPWMKKFIDMKIDMSSYQWFLKPNQGLVSRMGGAIR